MRTVSLLLALALLGGCGGNAGPTTARPLVVATTSLLAALAEPVAGDRGLVTSVVPVGASPETFEPTPADVAKLHGARVIIANGAGLEAWFARTLDAAKAPDARVVVLSDGMAVIGGNPHLWLDPEYARVYVGKIRDALIAADPDGAAGYRERAAAFDRQLAALGTRIARRIATIPRAQRAMLVFHPAWLYYDRRFGIRILGSVEEQPGREPSPDHLARLIDIARAAHVHAVFAEPEYDPRLLRTVAQGAGISRIVVLYDDSIGTSPQTRDYPTMLESDTEAIAQGLR